MLRLPQTFLILWLFALQIKKARTSVFVLEELPPGYWCTLPWKLGCSIARSRLLDNLMEIVKPVGNSCKEVISVCGQEIGNTINRRAYKM